MLNDYLARAHALAEAGQAFVIATVVRAHAPTSAKAGAKAIVTPDGALDGWVGGSCAQPTVVRESLKALADGTPRFLRLGPPEMLRGDQPGVIEVPLTCVSGGTLEIYLDPHQPPPRLLLIGHLPVVEALAALGADLGFAVTVTGDGVAAAQFPRADRVQAFDPAGLRVPAGAYVVVASHGHYDEPALEAVLAGPAAYVALVASQKRRAAVLDYLRGSGLPPEALARLKCPAGLDLGAVTPAEIALSILAEIVQLRRRGNSAPAAVAAPPAAPPAPELPASILAMRPAVIPTPGPGEALDPVCHMLVEIASARYKSEYNGRLYYFCAPGCKRSFDKDPHRYAAA
ncbi:MAG: XdhC family protein [Anaerolineales bacterium]|nr:XdhC family protein [Anaerolineales bacterium]